MGVDWGDYLHDGRIGMFVTNFTEQADTLYRNVGKGEFTDVSMPAKLAQPTYLNVGWGNGLCRFFQLWLARYFLSLTDTFYPQMDQIAGARPLRLSPCNSSATRETELFEDISSVFADIPNASRRGAAFGDLNNDGNVDIVVLNMDGPHHSYS